MYQNLLFDLDGTLTDSAEGITKCVQYGLKALGIDEPDLKKLYVFIGPPLRDSYMEYYGLTREQAEFGVEKYRERYTDTGIWENKAYAGILELLHDLNAAGFRCGMATAKPEVYALRIADHFGFDKELESISGCGLDGKTDKKEMVIAKALKKWGIVSDEDKAKTVLIGDRKEDVRSAHANGIACIGAGWGFGSFEELEEAGADAYIQSVDELREYFLKG